MGKQGVLRALLFIHILEAREVIAVSQAILEIKGMSKHFATTVALDKVDLSVYPGEIRGLIGENGSGKSTISSIAAGMQPATEGSMTFKGAAWEPKTMVEALAGGIGMIVQEQGTVGGASIAENLFIGKISDFQIGPFINRGAMRKKAREILEVVDMGSLDPFMPAGMLDLQDRKLIEIAKVVYQQPDIFVVDETTTALSQGGRDKVYALMREQKAAGKSVLFISHDLDELMEHCDTLTVLRDGKLVRNLDRSEFDGDLVKQLMVGRELQGDYYRSDYDPSCGEEIVLEIKNGNLGKQLKNINLQLHKGEIVGIGGLSGCGMHTLGKALFGAEKLHNGSVTAGGKLVHDTKTAVGLGLGYVSKDRDIEALNLGASIKDNIAIAGLDRFKGPGPLLLGQKEKAYVETQKEDLSIKCRNVEQSVSELSGGNKQKVVFGKWIGAGSDVLILDCPTRGVDIGVKQAMYQLIYKLKKEGKSFIIISEELAELIGMSDRLVIMKDGAITQEFARSEDLSESDVIGHMI